MGILGRNANALDVVDLSESIDEVLGTSVTEDDDVAVICSPSGGSRLLGFGVPMQDLANESRHLVVSNGWVCACSLTASLLVTILNIQYFKVICKFKKSTILSGFFQYIVVFAVKALYNFLTLGLYLESN